MAQLSDTIWHKWLKRPYRLHISTNHGSGSPVVLLHGLGRSADVWQHMSELLATKPVRTVALDLLGFGQSPKPDWLQYNTDDHAKAVIAAIRHLRLKQPVVLVGHSMGCLVAVRVARLRPDLVRHLILYEMPLYNGLPDKRGYRLRLKFYFALYERIVAFKPIFKGAGKKRAQKLAERIAGFTLDDATWKPFVRSLKHTIMEQSAHQDIKQIKLPMDVIYGTRDRVVIRGKTTEIFGEDVANITAHNIRENHGISKKASRFIMERIDAALTLAAASQQEKTVDETVGL
jgi:pimeloyl-ACP methyl ester carboxylesterase